MHASSMKLIYLIISQIHIPVNIIKTKRTPISRSTRGYTPMRDAMPSLSDGFHTPLFVR